MPDNSTPGRSRSAFEVRTRAASVALASSTAALLNYVDALPVETTEARLPGGWTPAGHVWHVAATHDIFVGTIDGTGPLPAFVGTSAFDDAEWNFNAPPLVAAPGLIVPPDGVRRDHARMKLVDSVRRLTVAIESLRAEQAELCVQLPWAPVTLMQMCEWGAGHTLRHLGQIGRELHAGTVRSVR